jgi:general secretion pathway protein G
MKNRSSRKRRGFSLLELLAVITILGIIAVVVIPRITTSAAVATSNADLQNRAEINSAVERYFFTEGVWPAADLSDIGSDPNYFPEGLPVNPVTSAAYTLDASHRVN